MNDQSAQIAQPGLKIATVWGVFAITSWSDFAAFLAAVYSALLIGEWVWKRVLRPFAERHGWLPRKARRKDDFK